MNNRNAHFIMPACQQGMKFGDIRVGDMPELSSVSARDVADWYEISKAAIAFVKARKEHTLFRHADYSTEEYIRRCDLWIDDINSEKKLMELVNEYVTIRDGESE